MSTNSFNVVDVPCPKWYCKAPIGVSCKRSVWLRLANRCAHEARWDALELVIDEIRKNGEQNEKHRMD